MFRYGRRFNIGFVARLLPEGALLDTVTLDKGDQKI